ncbi:MAG: glycosyltransferase family 4 protein [Candidatus Ozemobacteraceae bacterium]
MHKTSPNRDGFVFGHFNPLTIIFTFRLFIFAFVDALKNRGGIVYIVCATNGLALIRDLVISGIYLLLGRRINVHIRGTELAETTGLLRAIIKKVYGRCYLIYVSKPLMNSHSFLNSNGNASAIPNGCADYLDEACPPRKIDGSCLTLLFLSNFFVEKGILIFLDVVREMIQRGYSVKAIMCGSYSEKFSQFRLFDEINTRQISSAVCVLGPVDEVEKKRCINAAHFLIFPSLRESFGNVIIEAMSAKTYVISSATTSVDFILQSGTCGHILRTFTAASCADHICNLSPQAYKKTVENARERFLTHFRIEQHCQSLFTALR